MSPDSHLCEAIRPKSVVAAAARVHNQNTASVESFNSVRPFVIVESPYAGEVARNIAFARACIRDSLLRGEAPFASHLLYTQPGILRDEVHEERELGMSMGWHIMRRASLVALYTDLGFSSGMKRGREAAEKAGKTVVERSLMPNGQWVEYFEQLYGHSTMDQFSDRMNFPNV